MKREPEDRGVAGSRQKGAGKGHATEEDSDEGNPENKNSRHGSGGRDKKKAAPTLEQMAAQLATLTRLLEERPKGSTGGRARKLSWSGADSQSGSEDENTFDRDGRAGRKRGAGGQRRRDRSGGSKKKKKNELSAQTRQDIV